jgi:uncharacterized protein (DUF1501 family)
VTEGDTYRFSVIQVEGRTDEKALAAFLLQATFGPTRASIAEILAMGSDASSSIAAWIDHQLETPATLHRAYWRKNSNAPQNVQNRFGGPSHPCGSNTVWHRFAFSMSDGGKTLGVAPLAGGGYSLSIDGVVRTEVWAPEFLADAESGNFESVAPPYIICEVVQRDGVGGKVSIGNLTTCAQNTKRNVRPGFSFNWQLGAWGPITMLNPPITFGSQPTGSMTLGPTDATLVDAVDPGVSVMRSLEVDCPLTSVGPEDISFMYYDGEYFRHEPVTQLLENSLENPLTSPPSSFSAHPRERKSNFMACPSAAKTFLNRDTCVRRPDCVTPLEYSGATIVLNEETIRAMYSSSANRHVHAIDNLPFQPGQRSGYNPFDPELLGTQQVSGTRMASPCSASSRWKKLSASACAAETALDSVTLASIRAAILASDDPNPNVKDLGTIAGTCNGDDVIEALVTVDSECWQHTHPSNLNVYDWTSWVLENGALPAARDSFLDNPIGKAAQTGDVILNGADDDISWSTFTSTCFSGQHKSLSIDWAGRDRQSSSHRPGMMIGDMYDQLSSNAYLLGRLGDEISFSDLRVEFQTPELAELIGATVVGGGEWDGSEACGSPGEVANDATKGHNYGNYAVTVFGGKAATIYSHQRGLRSTLTGGFVFTATAVFENIAMKADDQLRQRVAWGLAQLHVLSAVGFSGSPMAEAEMWITYHDILVRHAFGNLRDALREISYSPMMGRYLTFINSVSYLNSRKHADENYAREFMELFTIGTYLRNPDGTPKLDSQGETIPTYSNKDVQNFGRAWTGFRKAAPRNNIEATVPGDSNMDPMDLQPRWRDPFPKTDVRGGHIGDGVPVCADLPDKMFLRKGATYVYRGWTQICNTPGTYAGGYAGCADTTSRFPRGEFGGPFGALTPSDGSHLFQALCSADAAGACTFPSVIKLTDNLPCHDDIECAVSTIKQVKVVTPTETVYYEYEPAPCVDLTFYNGGKTVKAASRQMCADPRTSAASPSCCNDALETGGPAMGLCNLARERVNFDEAQRRCSTTPDAPFGTTQYEPLPPAGQQLSYHMAADPAGNPTASECVLDSTPLEVRCCSDTQVGSFTSPAGIADAALAANVALGRPCTMSSVHRTSAPCSAAFDGDANPDMAGGSVIHTNRIEGEPSWVTVDLGATIPLEGVKITHRNAGVGRGNGALVIISATDDFNAADAQQCGEAVTFDSAFEATVYCPGISGRYVSFASRPYQFMHIAEMEVMAATSETCSAAFPDGMPFSSASFDNAVTQSATVPVVDGCVYARTHAFAEQVCAAEGARLCAAAEVAAECVAQAPCAANQGRMWTADQCSPEPDFMAVCSSFSTVAPAAQPETSCGELNNDWFWLDQACALSVAVDAEGSVAVAHTVPGASFTPPAVTLDDPGTLLRWGVRWTDGLHPNPSANCDDSVDCEVHSLAGQEDTCLCTVSVTELAVFTDIASLPSRKDVLERLKVGSAGPDTFDTGAYVQCMSAECEMQTYEIWLDAETNTLDINTILSTTVKTVPMHYKNIESMAGFSGFSFRNPPQFIKLEGSTLDTDVAYETEAVIDSFFYHDNHAPYIAHALIQRFVTSNPSPRYVQTVSEAFSTGTYGGRMYSGKYGDMAATVASMLLDSEARSTTLQSDGTHGMMREPFGSVIHLFRAMEYSSDYELALVGLSDQIGQQPYSSDTVFSYYEPDYQPEGQVAEAGLVSPESSLATGPLTVGMFNAIHSLVDYGLTDCYGGFARRDYDNLNGGTLRGCSNTDLVRSQAKGQLTLSPPADNTVESMIDQLDLLLTGGRLSASTKATIVDHVGTLHYSQSYMVSHGRGVVDPITGDEGISSYCASFADLHNVACCSDTPGGHGDRPYSAPSGHTAETCAAATDPLYAGTFVLENCDDANRNDCCAQNRNYVEAEAVCTADGARLCTAEEVEAGCVGFSGCSLERVATRGAQSFVWSNTPCYLDQTADAQRLATKLIVGTSEFRSTADNLLKSTMRPGLLQVGSQNREYKATVMIFLNGGADSFNMLVPHSNCAATDLYAQYAEFRGIGEGGAALLPNQLLPIDVPAGTQPCDTFGLHYKMSNIKQMYDDGEVSFIANMGSLFEPVTAEEMRFNTKRVPKGLFGHANGRKQAQNTNAPKGILGRITDALMTQENPYKSSVYSIYLNPFAVAGRVAAKYISWNRGVEQFVSYGQVADTYYNISARESTSMYANTWATQLTAALDLSMRLGDLYSAATTTDSFDITCPHVTNVRCDLNRQLQTVAKMTSMRGDTENERETFFVSIGGFDLHQDSGTTFGHYMSVVDQSLAAFKREMVHQGIWDNVAVVTTSDFARTLKTNGVGTDHAWGGHYMMAGGSVNGGQIHGKPAYIS